MLTSRNERQHYREQLSYATNKSGVLFDLPQCIKLEEIVRDADLAELLDEDYTRLVFAYRRILDENTLLRASWWERLKHTVTRAPYVLAYRVRRLAGKEPGW